MPESARRDRAYCGPACRKSAYNTRQRSAATMAGGHAQGRKDKPRPVVQAGTSWDGARDDLATFSALIGRPLTPAQARLGQLDRRVTVVIAPRQTGKSRSLSNLGTWWAFRRPNQHVLIVSASDDAARRLLSEVKSAVARPPLSGSVVDDLAAVVRLTNGSVIRSVPASERAIRGWTVDLLLVDEAALVPDDILAGAAIPTTAARPDARIVLASTPWAQAGLFYSYVLSGDSEYVRLVAWTLHDAPWIARDAIEHARATLPEARFRAEYQAEFVSDESAYFSADLLLSSVADYALVPPTQARGGSVVVGADWGRSYDSHAIATLGIADDGDANGHPVLFVPWLETSQRPYADQIQTVGAVGHRPAAPVYRHEGADRPIQPLGGGVFMYDSPRTFFEAQEWRQRQQRPGYEVVRWVSEANGVGAAPSEDLVRLVGRTAVDVIYTTQRSKEDQLGRLRTLLAAGNLVLPAHADLLRQLRGLAVRATPTGALSIAAANPAVHDDLPDALCLAVGAVPYGLAAGSTSPRTADTEWLTTPAGIRIPKYPRPRRSALADMTRRMVTFR
jgi:hypothetical protein